MLRLGARRELLVRKREGVVSPHLLRGLSLAFTFHLVLFLGFRIISPPRTELFLPLDPVAVEVDLGVPRAAVEPVSQVVGLSPMERVELPPYFEMPQPQLTAQLEGLTRRKEPDFREIERLEYEVLEGLDD